MARSSLQPINRARKFRSAIDSRLSAVVADSMTGRRHRSNAELVAQGVANTGSAVFGGICVTGTIARTATNVFGNCLATAVVARWEGELGKEAPSDTVMDAVAQ